MILILDFGSQTTHLICRRLEDLGIDTRIVDPDEALAKIEKHKPAGIILSGGPASVYDEGAPSVDKAIFALQIPVLGICYGWQLMAHLLEGEVKSGKKEYGPARLEVQDFSDLFYGLPNHFQVFMSHGDSVMRLPSDFVTTASTKAVKFAAVRHRTRKLFGVQFHPELDHTQDHYLVLKNFATRECNLALKPQNYDLQTMIEEIKQKVGSAMVIGAFSGGTDSAVAGSLVARAIGNQFIPIYVDSGLMRAQTLGRIQQDFPKVLGIDVQVVEAKAEFLQALKEITDPEAKRKTIGKLYIDIFEREMKKHGDVQFLLQGTTYADFIHSQGSKRSAKIKSHHNVGGLPKDMKLKLLEPLRYFYTDQVRQLGEALGLPKDMVYQQPFPGPGHAVRVVGEVTKERLQKQVQADQIVVDVLKETGWYEQVFQCWSIMTGAWSTAVKGDGRFYGEVVAVRVLHTKDRMSAEWVRLPHEVLDLISTRIVNEVPEISRVVYDITSKPPATMEWE